MEGGAWHVVNDALRATIADAYTAFVGQVDCLPDDTYGEQQLVA